MNQTEEIRNYFSSLNLGKTARLSTIPDYPSWVLRLPGEFGVGIEITKNHQINESFASADFYTASFLVENEYKYLLVLTSGSEELRYEFAAMCAMFLEPGPDGEDREEILEKPLDWWNSFKELIGNKSANKSVHDILGEMLAFLYIYRNDHSAVWTGPRRASIDIETVSGSYEVKSTTNRYDSVIEVSSQYQLASDRNQYLLFCRFEKSIYGHSINDLSRMLISKGYSETDIESALTRSGFAKNASVRREKYLLLEMRQYSIDSDFPVIRLEQLSNQKFADHIVQLKYKIDLKGLASESVDLHFMKSNL